MKKTEGYSSATLHAKRNSRRQDAEARHRLYDQLTSIEQIALCDSRRGQSKREVARILKKLQGK
jgi:hypothetical protein